MVTRDRNVIVEVEGAEVGLRVNNWALKETQKKTGCKGIIELFHKIGIDDGNIDNDAFTILLMESVNEYNHHQKINKKITEREASDLIDRMGGIIQALQILSDGISQYVPKNSEPPVTTGEQILQ